MIVVPAKAGDCMPLENGRASFDFAQDEAIFLMPSTISPHPGDLCADGGIVIPC
jgi:hypothetical protein